jgi:hypothetical protein
MQGERSVKGKAIKRAAMRNSAGGAAVLSLI